MKKTTTAVTKKPAAKGTLKKPAASLSSRGMAAAILAETTEEHAKEKAQVTRDHLKQHQWNKNLQDLPEALQKEWQEASRAKKNSHGEWHRAAPCQWKLLDRQAAPVVLRGSAQN